MLSKSSGVKVAHKAQGARCSVVGKVAFTPKTETVAKIIDPPTITSTVVATTQDSLTAPVPPQSLNAGEEAAWMAGFQAGLQAAKAEAPKGDSMTRTALKSLSWRILSTSTTIALALLIFKDNAMDEAMELGAMEFISKYGLFFIHERIWAAITLVL